MIEKHDEHNHDHHGNDPHDHDHHGNEAGQHGNDHDHHGHSHDTSDLSDNRLLFSVVLNLLLTVVEAVVGVFSGSLALIADSVHNLGDVGALIVAWVARRIAKRQADDRFTFGYRRAELVGAVINLTVLLVMAVFMTFEGIQRLLDPRPIQTTWVIIAASVATVVDLGTVALLWGMSKGNLNIRAAFVHNLTDAAASIAVIIGAILVQTLGWLWIDPALCLMIAAYILVMSVPMLKHAASILMNHVPRRLDLDGIAATFHQFEEVEEIHHLHVWEIDEKSVAIEAHVVLKGNFSLVEAQSLTKRIRARLQSEWQVGHTTFEYEPPDSDCHRREC
jgi:cobalt-zinc-cadmium efflux system protein